MNDFIAAIGGKPSAIYTVEAVHRSTGEVITIDYATRSIAEEVAAEYRQAGHQAIVKEGR